MRRRLKSFFLIVAVLLAGCTPSGFVARQLIRAPNTFPQVVSPEPRVYFTFPAAVLDTFPLQRATVGVPPVTLAYRVLPPAAHHLTLILTNHLGPSGPHPLFLFRGSVPGTPTAFTDHPRGTVVLLHGYGLSQDSMVPWALILAEAGWRCVLVDLRGHGDSTGDRIYFGRREASDLTSLIDELVRRDQASWPVAAVGVSYGAAVALRWQIEEPRVRSGVAISPYARLGDAVEGLREDYAAWLPAGVIRRATDKIPALIGTEPDGLDPLNWIRKDPVAALFVAGSDDVVASPEAVRNLARAAAKSQVIEVEGVGHEILPFQMDQLREPVERWLMTNQAGMAPTR